MESRSKFICVTVSFDSDTINKDTNPASQCKDRRTSIDVSLIKQEVREMNGGVRWIDGRTMLADSLTKDTKGDFLREVMVSGKWSILEEGVAFQRKPRRTGINCCRCISVEHLGQQGPP